MNENTLIISHKGCPDGTCAAAVAAKRYPGAQTHFALHGDSPPDVKGLDVYILDFSYPRETLEAMHRAAKSLTVLDHHKSAQGALQGLSYAHFDMSRSGAGMAWDYFFAGSERPWIVNYTEDRDLWRFALPDSRAVSDWIGSLPFDRVDGFRSRLSTVGNPPLYVIDQGRAIGRYIRKYCAQVAQTATRGTIAGHDVPVVNAAYPAGSDLLHVLCEGEKFAARYQVTDRGYEYSLRSSETGLDVSEIAARFGGGGHEHASGFVSPDRVH